MHRAVFKALLFSCLPILLFAQNTVEEVPVLTSILRTPIVPRLAILPNQASKAFTPQRSNRDQPPTANQAPSLDDLGFSKDQTASDPKAQARLDKRTHAQDASALRFDHSGSSDGNVVFQWTGRRPEYQLHG
jgi:hypothetical protein